MPDPHQEPPRLPDIHDEAADTPNWVPLVGLALLTLAVLYFGIRGSLGPDGPPGTAEQADVDAPGAPDTGAADEGAADEGAPPNGEADDAVGFRPGALAPRGAALGGD